MGYRATVKRDDGEEQDWGFSDLDVLPDGTLCFTLDDGVYDLVAGGTWREVTDMFEEEG